MGLRRRGGGRFEPRHVSSHLIVEERRLPGTVAEIAASPGGADIGGGDGDRRGVGELRERFVGSVERTDGSGGDHEQLVPAESFGDFAVRMGAIALDVAERRQTGRRYKVPRAPIPGIEAR